MSEETRPLEHKRKAGLLKVLEQCAKSNDLESAHGNADKALLEFIDDPEVTEAYNRVESGTHD